MKELRISLRLSRSRVDNFHHCTIVQLVLFPKEAIEEMYRDVYLSIS